MSRSEVTEKVKNPAKYFLNWDGTNGGFIYWDKEKQEKVALKLPVKFMVLDTLATIKGYSNKEKCGYSSGEVKTKDLKTAQFNVGVWVVDPNSTDGKKKFKSVAKGTYDEVMSSKNTVGAKYCQSVYVALLQDKGLVLANFQMKGTALSAWIDYGKKNKIYDGAVKVEKMIDGQNGVTKYKTPVFEAMTTDANADAKAKEIDKELQAYFEHYFKTPAEEQKEETPNE